VKRPNIDLELLDRSCVDGSVGAWVGNGLKTRRTMRRYRTDMSGGSHVK
jgi:hypothetical protein